MAKAIRTLIYTGPRAAIEVLLTAEGQLPSSTTVLLGTGVTIREALLAWEDEDDDSNGNTAES